MGFNRRQGPSSFIVVRAPETGRERFAISGRGVNGMKSESECRKFHCSKCEGGRKTRDQFFTINKFHPNARPIGQLFEEFNEIATRMMMMSRWEGIKFLRSREINSEANEV